MSSRQSDMFEERFILFSISIIKLMPKLTGLPQSIVSQVTRSSASIGANYAEAQNAVSKADFKNKIAISKKEAAETQYWLKLIDKLSKPDLLSPYLKECHEILLILQKIVNTLKSKSAT